MSSAALAESAAAMQQHAQALADLTRQLGQTSDPARQAALESLRQEVGIAFMEAHARYAKARDETAMVARV